MFSNISQMTSKRGKNKKVAHVVQPSVSLIVDSGVIFAPGTNQSKCMIQLILQIQIIYIFFLNFY